MSQPFVLPKDSLKHIRKLGSSLWSGRLNLGSTVSRLHGLCIPGLLYRRSLENIDTQMDANFSLLHAITVGWFGAKNRKQLLANERVVYGSIMRRLG
jgi:hypothetical protein